MGNDNNTNNGGWDSMNGQANAGKGLLATIFIGAGAMAAKKSHDGKKLAELEHELRKVQDELSKKKGNIFKEAWYTSEIAQLEKREKELLAEIKKLK